MSYPDVIPNSVGIMTGVVAVLIPTGIKPMPDYGCIGYGCNGTNKNLPDDPVDDCNYFGHGQKKL